MPNDSLFDLLRDDVMFEPPVELLQDLDELLSEVPRDVKLQSTPLTNDDISSTSTNGMEQSARKPVKKKRPMRRQKRELLELREKVGTLTTELQQLQTRLSRQNTQKAQDSVDVHKQARDHAENENSRLRRLVEKQALEAMTMSRAFEVWPQGLHAVGDYRDSGLYSDEDHADFVKLLGHVNATHDRVDDFFSDIEQMHGSFDRDFPFWFTAQNGDGGMNTSVMHQVAIPLHVDVVSRAIWRMLAHEGGGTKAYYQEPYFVSNDVCAQKIGTIRGNEIAVHMIGKRVVRQFRSNGRTVTIIHSRSRPLRIMDKPVHGVTIVTTGVITSTPVLNGDEANSVFRMGTTYEAIPDDKNKDWMDTKLGELLNVTQAQRIVSKEVTNLMFRVLDEENTRPQ